jgi:hypothetical protein
VPRSWSTPLASTRGRRDDAWLGEAYGSNAMKRRSRTRRLFKWAGTVGCALIAVVWVLSHSGYAVGHFQPRGSVLLLDGRICQPRAGVMPSFFVGREGWHVFRKGELIPALDDLSVPLWLPMLLVLVPTAMLWWGDIGSWWANRRRMPTGHCSRCGYDLTGNVSGRCPECGERLETGGR